MSSMAIGKFLNTLKVHFPPRLPRPELEEAWLQSMTKVLRGYEAGVLEDAAMEIVRTRKRTDFPRPAECRSACEEVLKWRQISKREAMLPIDKIRDAPDYSPDRIALADDLIRTEQGRKAAKEGWVLSLHDYCRKHGCAPKPDDVPAIKRAANEFQEGFEMCLRGRVGWMQQKEMTELGEKMNARREELSDMVLHGVVRR